MRSILQILPSFDAHGHVRQATLLATTLPGERFTLRCMSLKGSGLFEPTWREAGIPILGTPRQRWFDLDEIHHLRKLLENDRPDLIHVWGLEGLARLWWATLGRRSLLPPLVASLHPTMLKKNHLRLVDRRLFNQVRTFVVASETDKQAFEIAGIAPGRLRVIRPGVPLPESIMTPAEFRARHGITGRIFMGVGHIQTPARFLHAVWAFEMLSMIDKSPHLVLIGDGPARKRMASTFMISDSSGMGVHFLGETPQAASLLLNADIVLVPHQHQGGTHAVLEGMAAGKPVIASDLPHLRELIRPDETGILAKPGDPPGLARAMMRMLENEERGRQLGEAARADVVRRFPLAGMTDAFAALYDETSA